MANLAEHEFLKVFGLNIKAIRNKKGWSLEDVSKHGFEKASLSRLEAGKGNITLKTLYRLSKALDVAVGEFF